MDSLSISASIVALLQLTNTVIGYLNDASHALKDRSLLLSELYSITGMLYLLRDKVSQSQPCEAWSSTLRLLGVFNGPLDQFKATLEQLKAKLRPRKVWREAGASIIWPFQKGEIKQLLSTIERQKSFFILAQQNDHVEISKAMKGEVESLHADLTRLRLDGSIRQWLNAPDPSVNYNRALDQRSPGTGTWFIESQGFSEWKTTSGSFFWLYGIPGCGKSILSSTIIEAILKSSRSKPTVAVAYFYFDFNDVEKQQHEKMIRSLVFQVCSQCTDMPKALGSLHSAYLNGNHQPTYDSLLIILHRILTDFEETYLVIDALDECLERQELLSDIEEITSWKDVNLHILTTGRREKDIEESVDSINEEGKISIQSALINGDIDIYIRARLQGDRNLRRWRDNPEALQEILETLTNKADGMFRWVACQLDSLRKCLTHHGLQKALGSLPMSLDDTYAQALCNIDEEYKIYTLKILQWLTYSARPLRLEEIAEVIAIDSESSPRFDPRKRLYEPRDILTICSSLISLDDNEKYGTLVRLAHFSVKEYLVSDRILKGNAKWYSIEEIDAHVVIQNDCLAYLLELDRVDTLNDQVYADFPLIEYAARYWTSHARLVEEKTGLEPLLANELLLTQANGLLNWLRLYNPDDILRRAGFKMDRDRLCTPLYYSCRNGLRKSVQILLDLRADVNAQGGFYGNALQAASNKGYLEIVRMILDSGADVNAQGGYFGNALQAACYNGYREIVQIFIDSGADINLEGGFYNNALAAASIYGYKEIIQILINSGADVNAREKVRGAEVYGSALRTALFKGYREVVQLLVDSGADVDAHGDALQAASFKNHRDVVQILLSHGADINAQGDHWPNALQAASFGGNKEIVKMLLNHEASIHAQCVHLDSALQAAAKHGHSEVVRILLEHGADVDAQTIDLDRALQAALRNGHSEVVRMLLAHGAGIDAQGSEIDDLIQAASDKDHSEVVRILLEHAAAVDAQGINLDGALKRASRRGRNEVMRILLEHAAAVGAQGVDLDSALQEATKWGNGEIVRMLLEHAADAGAPSIDVDSALEVQAVVRDCNREAMQILREYRARARNSWDP